jgi:hypothetical protein
MQPARSALRLIDRTRISKSRRRAVDWHNSRWVVDALAMFVPIVGSIALFGFLAVASWAEARRKEREAFFHHEILKKVAEDSSANGERVVELLRQEESNRVQRVKDRIRMAGSLTLASGVGISLFISQLVSVHGLWAVGVIPALVGLAMIANGLNIQKRSSFGR